MKYWWLKSHAVMLDEYKMALIPYLWFYHTDQIPWNNTESNLESKDWEVPKLVGCQSYIFVSCPFTESPVLLGKVQQLLKN